MEASELFLFFLLLFFTFLVTTVADLIIWPPPRKASLGAGVSVRMAVKITAGQFEAML